MDEKQKKSVFAALKTSKQWTYLLAASMLTLVPITASASATGSENENTVQAVQQAKKTVTGLVKDANGEPIIGATVAEVGNATNATITDANGNYRLQIKPGSRISVSSIGYQQQTLAAKANVVNVTLEEDQAILDEVVVVAYGTQKKKDLTGSMTAVKAENIAVQNTTTVSRALEGAAPGIRVSSVDGQPGYDMAVRIRGVSSTNGASAAALIVIDGVAQQTNSTYENPLSQLDPNDIASVSILKDAASTALYGSRGANGVVLITTKKGQSGKAKISFESRWGWNSIGDYNVNSIDNAAQYYEYVWKSIYNSYRYGVNGTGLPGTDASGRYYTNVGNPNHSDADARLFASQHLFDYNNSETAFQKNLLGNNMAYSVPGAIYTNTGSGSNSSSTMTGAYLIDPETGRMNPQARQLYSGDASDLLFRNAFRQEYNLSASGGSDKAHYYFSLGYQDDPSFLLSSEFRRYSGRANMDAQVLKWLKVGANIGYSNTKTRAQAGKWGSRQIGGASGNAMLHVKGWSPIYPVYQMNEDGTVATDDKGNILNVYNKSWSPLGENHVADRNFESDYMYITRTNMERQDIINWTSRFFAQIDFLDHFNFTVNFNMDEQHWRRTAYMNSIAGRAKGQGSFGLKTYTRRIINTQQLLSYDQDFGKHHVDALVGHEYEDLDRKDVNFGTSYELLPGYIIPGNFVGHYTNYGGENTATPSWGLNTYRTESYLGRANYNYAERYYASASLRRDASSKFTKDNRWGTFWSLGAGWRFSEEPFLKSAKSWLDNAKLRLSYGVTGNSNGLTSYYLNQTYGYGVSAWQEGATGTGVPKVTTITGGNLVRTDLTWEVIHQFDLGLDFSVLGSRLTGAIDYYNNLTSNALYNQMVSPLANMGSTTLQKNAAKIRNTGIEIELDADIIRTKDWTWSVGVNATHYTTKLVKVPADQIPNWDNTMDVPKGTWVVQTEDMAQAGTASHAGRGDFYLRGEGKDLFNLYMYKYAGVDQASGLPMYWHRVTYADTHPDANGAYAHGGRYAEYKQGDNVKTTVAADASEYECGSAIPDVMGGITTNLRWKDFDLGIVAAYQLGGKFFSMEYAQHLFRGSSLGGDRIPVSKDVVGATWTPDNTGAKYPMQWFNSSGGSYYLDGVYLPGSHKYTDMALFSASYFRLKNITLGYTVPKNLLRKIGISKLRAFVSADNLLIFSAQKGVDPSMSAIGGKEVDTYIYPQMQTITLGLNLEF